MKWWQQLLSGNQWAYDVSQPPLVYTGKVGGKTHRVVSVATMEGVWFAFDAETGQPFHERVKVIDRVEHPPLRPGQPVTVFPSSLGGLNYSPAAYDPTTNYVFNAAAETAAVLIQQKLTPTQKKRKFLLGDVYLGLENGNFGTALQNWHDHGSISAIDVSTRPPRLEVPTPEPERGGVTLTASGLGFAGGGDGVLRAFALKTGKVLWTFHTGRPIASGPTIFSRGRQGVRRGHRRRHADLVERRRRVAAPGVRARRSQQHAGDAERARRPHPVTHHRRVGGARRARRQPRARRREAAHRDRGRRRRRSRSGRPRARTRRRSNGRVFLGGSPVVGARVAVDRYASLQTRPTRSGGFSRASTRRCRSAIRCASSTHRTRRVGGRALTARRAERAACGERGHLRRVPPRRPAGAACRRTATSRSAAALLRADGAPAPGVVLLSYRLSGTVTDASGQPRAGRDRRHAARPTATSGRSRSPSNANGHYVSFFSASDEQGSDPVPLNVQVAVGQRSYSAGLAERRLQAAAAARRWTSSCRLRVSGCRCPSRRPNAGAVYRGLIVGVLGPRGVIKPLSVRWPDAQGRFSLVLPHARPRDDAALLGEQLRDVLDRCRPARRTRRIPRRCRGG